MTQTVVLTGAGRGLGRAMCRGLIAAGATVHGCTHAAESLDSLQSEFGAPHTFAQVDVAVDEQVAEWSQRVLGSGVPDLLINNAALINANARLWQVPPDEFQRVLGVNVAGSYHVIRHFVPAMIERGTGVIVNFSSGWGRQASAEVAPYCATKFAIEGLTAALAVELPKGLAAVALNPGIINTAMLQSCMGSTASLYREPEAWAERAVPFLLELGAGHNGRSLTVPG